MPRVLKKILTYVLETDLDNVGPTLTEHGSARRELPIVSQRRTKEGLEVTILDPHPARHVLTQHEIETSNAIHAVQGLYSWVQYDLRLEETPNVVRAGSIAYQRLQNPSAWLDISECCDGGPPELEEDQTLEPTHVTLLDRRGLLYGPFTTIVGWKKIVLAKDPTIYAGLPDPEDHPDQAFLYRDGKRYNVSNNEAEHSGLPDLVLAMDQPDWKDVLDKYRGDS